MAQGCHGGYPSLLPSHVILSRVPVNGPRPICLPCKQTEIGLEVVRLISRINPATGEEEKGDGEGGKRAPLFNAMHPRGKNTFSILIKKKYCRGICITKISPSCFSCPFPLLSHIRHPYSSRRSADLNFPFSRSSIVTAIVNIPIFLSFEQTSPPPPPPLRERKREMAAYDSR